MSRATLLLAVAVLACGRKSGPVAPQLVKPETPGALVAASVAAGVRLTWRRPDSYTSGRKMNDLGSFTIERATGAAPFELIGELKLDDRLRFRKDTSLDWIDHEVTPGQEYSYRVIAITIDEYESAPAGPIAITFEPKAESKPPPASKPAKGKP